MKLNFKFSNLLGTVYRKGNILFSPDGDTVISPVGNKITFYNLKEHKSETLAIESSFDIVLIALDAAGNGLLVFDEKGESYYVSLISQTIIHRHSFHKSVKSCRFSPDSKYFIVCRDVDALLFRAPGLQTGQYNPFFLDRTYRIAHDAISTLDWSHDSKLFAAGSSDCVIRVCATQRYEKFYVCHLSGHSSPIVGCFFDKLSYDVISVDRQGYLIRWECMLDIDTLKNPSSFDIDEIPEFSVLPRTKPDDIHNEQSADEQKLKFYKRTCKHSFRDSVPGSSIQLMTACYHTKNKLLITGHSNGTFVMHEMPDFNLIHSLNVSDRGITSLAINSTGDWLAVASSTLGQLLVWEWQSETYIMKQQGHFHSMNCVSYSPDGQFVATGGQDSKVKVWTVSSGFCFVTFSEHTGNVTGLAWTQGGKAIVSSSLDGTVRAFDMKRYRNFRTFVSPQPVQFSCIAVDSSGDLVCCGCLDIFDVYLWSMNTGKLLEILTGHEAPVVSLHFNPTNASLVSGSWDKTIRIWEIFDGKQGKEVISHTSDVLSVQFSPDGKFVACCTLNCQIFVYDWRDSQQVACIEGRLDLDVGRGATDEIGQKKLNPLKSFTTLCFSANGEYLLAGGASRYICIYHVKEQILVKKFLVTCNRSLNYVADDIDRRKMSEFGNLALIDASDSEDELKNSKVQLPGVKTGDLGQRSHHPDIRVYALQFSPTGRSWAACTTEGLLVYSLDHNLLFDPYQLETVITPSRIHCLLRNEEYGEAVVMALKLNEEPLIVECIEKIPPEQIDFVCRDMPPVYVEKLLAFLSGNQYNKTSHVEFYLRWIRSLFYHHTTYLKSKTNSLMPILTSLQQNISRRHQEIGKICEHNKYSLSYLTNLRSRRCVKSERVHKESTETERSNVFEKATFSSSDEDDLMDTNPTENDVIESM